MIYLIQNFLIKNQKNEDVAVDKAMFTKRRRAGCFHFLKSLSLSCRGWTLQKTVSKKVMFVRIQFIEL